MRCYLPCPLRLRSANSCRSCKWSYSTRSCKASSIRLKPTLLPSTSSCTEAMGALPAVAVAAIVAVPLTVELAVGEMIVNAGTYGIANGVGYIDGDAGSGQPRLPHHLSPRPSAHGSRSRTPLVFHESCTARSYPLHQRTRHQPAAARWHSRIAERWHSRWPFRLRQHCSPEMRMVTTGGVEPEAAKCRHLHHAPSAQASGAVAL